MNKTASYLFAGGAIVVALLMTASWAFGEPAGVGVRIVSIVWPLLFAIREWPTQGRDQ